MNKKFEFRKKDIVSTIILENYERFFESKSHLLPSKNIDNILDTIEKMKPCKDKAFGFSQYICPNCYESHKVAFSCKSRFCNSCGKVYADKWIEKQKDLMLDVKHRHMVFTIPHNFRIHIYKNFSIIKLLFNACFNVILGSLNSSFKSTKKPTKKFLKFTKGINSLRLINRKLFLIKKSKVNFTLRLKMTYGIDPFICPKCSTEMILLDIWHHKYGIIFSIFNNESNP